MVFTSEVSVEVTGTGIGGACQEVALATAIELKKRHDQNDNLKVLYLITAIGPSQSTFLSYRLKLIHSCVYFLRHASSSVSTLCGLI